MQRNSLPATKNFFGFYYFSGVGPPLRFDV
ncbi:MAG: hypothetical protein PWR02_1879 [Synergistales bacterium]|jgi:hypothetical protein|nr:hypothetical protein [Synergistales bacterium]MDN5336853.1 hypothetical protein [Synergistales bacterium]